VKSLVGVLQQHPQGLYKKRKLKKIKTHYEMKKQLNYKMSAEYIFGICILFYLLNAVD